MLSGTSPFKDASEWLIFQRIIARDVKFPDYFSNESRDLIDQLLVSYTCPSGELCINNTHAPPFVFSYIVDLPFFKYFWAYFSLYVASLYLYI